jgi:transcriptional regulator with XRE-family HTH domain
MRRMTDPDYLLLNTQLVGGTSTKAIGARLKLTREALGYQTQAAWCAFLGGWMSTQKWNNYERARDRIPVDHALRISQAVGVSLDWIYRGEPALLPLQVATALRRLNEAKRPSANRA